MTVLERNDVAVVLRSDVRSHVTTARQRLLAPPRAHRSFPLAELA